MKFTTKYINDMLSCAKSKLAGASSAAWKMENFGLYGPRDSVGHIYELQLYIFLIARFSNSHAATNATTEEALSCMFDHIIRMPYPCVLAVESVEEIVQNRPPIVDAGPDQSLSAVTTSSVLAGTVTDPDNDDFTVLWERLGGGNVTINSPTSLITNITNMQQGVYNFRLTATDSKGASASDTVLVTIAQTLDTIYYWRDDNPFPGSGQAAYIQSKSSIQADGSLAVAIPWHIGSTGPQWCGVAIPNRTSGSNKNSWYVDVINQGAMGGATDLFGAPQTINISGTDYLVWNTNYQTQFPASCLLRKL